MLILKYLFDNRDLALMLLSYWEYDEEALEIMDRFRISFNAVYSFYRKGERYLKQLENEFIDS